MNKVKEPAVKPLIKFLPRFRLFKRWRLVRHVRMVARIRDFSTSPDVKAACTDLLHALVTPDPR